MEGSILDDIRKAVGAEEWDDAFDDELITHTNSVFMILTQMGIGPAEGYVIDSDDNQWDEFVSDPIKYRLVKSYMGLKVRLLFDPPLSSAVMQSMNNQIAEYEWRLTAAAELDKSNGEEESQNGKV
jgi:hypothetical protein